MNMLVGIIIGLVVLMSLVVAHEFGHFIMARRNGVKVNEFGIGFPPRAVAWLKNPEYEKWRAAMKKAKADKKPAPKTKRPKKWLRLPKSEWGKTEKTLIFSINWLPIGGFCAMDGESDSDTKKGTFGAATFWGKTKILFGGVTANWLVAFVIFTILAITGMPHFIDNQFTVKSDTTVLSAPVYVSEVLEKSPAEKSGLEKDDMIISATSDEETVPINSTTDLTDFNSSHAGEKVSYHISRDDKDKTIKAKLNDKDSDYFLGITMYQKGQTLYRSTWSAPLVGAATTVQLTGETFRGLWDMVWNLCSGIAKQLSPDGSIREEGRSSIKTAGDSVSGPVGIIGIVFPAFTEAGPTNLAFLAALISVSLACMNVLPIPALDGGRWTLIALFRLRGKTLTKETEERIVSRAFIFLLVLIVLITVLDITRFF